jgi:hypothetical protein
MSISIKHGNDTYTFGSDDGSHYWYLSDTPRQTYNKILGMKVSYDFRSILYERAISQGYTDYDFEQYRTRSKSQILDSKPSKRASPRIVSERKSLARKSTLTNSIKLF